jgi:hypothetical protein
MGGSFMPPFRAGRMQEFRRRKGGGVAHIGAAYLGANIVPALLWPPARRYPPAHWRALTHQTDSDTNGATTIGGPVPRPYLPVAMRFARFRTSRLHLC